MTQSIEKKINSLSSLKVIQTLSIHRHELKSLGVKSLRLFGSVARDEARPDSDLDFLVEFVNEPSFFELFEVQYFLKDLFHCKIDLGIAHRFCPAFPVPVIEPLWAIVTAWQRYFYSHRWLDCVSQFYS